MSNAMGQGYAGDTSSSEAFEALAGDPSAVLVDVRTTAEWNFVGVPDLGSLGRDAVFIEWQSFAGGANGNFVAQLSAALAERGAGKDAPVYFLCRSGGRSRAAAIAMTDAGYSRCFNVSGGFEGPLDPGGHRGRVDGWKQHGLPWRQS